MPGRSDGPRRQHLLALSRGPLLEASRSLFPGEASAGPGPGLQWVTGRAGSLLLYFPSMAGQPCPHHVAVGPGPVHQVFSASLWGPPPVPPHASSLRRHFSAPWIPMGVCWNAAELPRIQGLIWGEGTFLTYCILLSRNVGTVSCYLGLFFVLKKKHFLINVLYYLCNCLHMSG